MSTAAIPNVAAMINGDLTLGKIRWLRMRRVRLPAARDASTNGSSRMASAVPRTSRVRPNTNTIDRARITFLVPGPRMAATARASTIGGKLRPPSVMRMSTLSTVPPVYPEKRPTTRAMAMAMAMTETPTRSETRAP